MEPMLSEYAGCDATSPGWIVQPKLNGLRCWYSPRSRTMHMRGGGVITSCPHILADLIALGQPVDGELYVHGWPLERIRCAVQRMRPSDDSLALRLHAFDLCDTTRTQADRIAELGGLALPSTIDRVESRKVSGPRDAMTAYAEWLAAGYEGIIMRNPSLAYRFGARVTLKHKLHWD